MKRAGRIFALLFFMFITVIGASIGPAHAATGDFSLSNRNTYPFGSFSTNLGIPNGASPSFDIVANNLANVENAVTFSSKQNATGPTVSFNPKTVPLAAAGLGSSLPTTVTITVSASVPHGAYAINITGTSGPYSHSIIFQIKVYSIALTIDAQSSSQTDTTVSLAEAQTKTFRVGVLVSNATNNLPLGTPGCTISFPCAFRFFGFQFGLNYDPAILIPQGDPGSLAHPDGAQNVVTFGGQTNIGEGTSSLASLITDGKAFQALSLSSGKIVSGLSLIAPTPSAVLVGSTSTPRFLLGSVSFELLDKSASPSQITISTPDLIFTDVNQRAACSCVISTSPGEGSIALENIANTPPVSSFNAIAEVAGSADCVPITGMPCSGYAFSFDASTSSDPDGNLPLSYFWDFGDGATDLTGSQVTIIHDYATTGAAPGSFIVTLRVADSLGATGSARDTLGSVITNIQPSHTSRTVLADTAPNVSFSPDKTVGTRVSPVSLSINATDDSIVVQTRVDWGDGKIDTFPGAVSTDSHTYSALGAFMITITATDDVGLTSSSSRILNIVDVPPTAAVATSSSTAQTGVSITFDGSTSSDPDGTIVSYSWNFGDGSPPMAGMVVTHVYANTGNVPVENFTVTLTVVDDNGSVGSTTTAETISDRPPVAAFTFAPSNPVVGQTVSFNALSSADPDGTVVNYSWSFGDLTTGSGALSTHVFTGTGTFTVTLTVLDNSGNTAAAATTVTVIQLPGAHASLEHWKANPALHNESISTNPTNTLRAFAINDGNRTVWAYVRFHIMDISGTTSNLYTQTVQLTPGQTINGKTDSRFTTIFTPARTGTFSVTAVIFYSPALSQPAIGDPSFQADLVSAKTFSFTVTA